MPIWPFAAYTAAMIGLILRLAQPTAICFGLAGLVSGPSTLNTHGTPSAARIGPTKRMAGWKVRAKANAMPHSLPTSLTCSGVKSMGRPSASKQSAVPHLDEAARLPCLTTFTPAAAATTAPMDDRFTVEAPSPPVPTMSVVSPSMCSGMAWATMAFAAPRTSSGVSPNCCWVASTAPTAAGSALPFIRSSTNHSDSSALKWSPPTSLVRIDFHVISAMMPSLALSHAFIVVLMPPIVTIGRFPTSARPYHETAHRRFFKKENLPRLRSGEVMS